MLLQRFYDDGLAQASYLIGCDSTGEALVVDANRHVEPYLEAAQAEDLRITQVTETHIHADFVSGSRELAQRCGARLYLSDEGGPDWRYGYAAVDGATLLKDGDRLQVGKVGIDVLHTPGHTPEHLAFLVTDTAGAAAPMGLLSGDFVFVGDVVRPDLLERAVNLRGTMEASARQLFRSLQRLSTFPDYLQLWPGHGAGSACGKALGAVPQSTLGYERIVNWAFRIASENEFVTAALEGQPEPPRYFGEMKRINRDGPRLLGALQRPPRLDVARIAALVAAGAMVVDTRPAAEFAAGHLPGTINIPLNRAFTTWAGWLVPYAGDCALLVDSARPEGIDEAVRDLAMIGLDRVAGYAELDRRATRDAVGVIHSFTVQQLAERMRQGAVTVVDVRDHAEWQAGHLRGVANIPLGTLAQRIDEVPPTGAVVLHCQSGSRSAIAASLLQARGRSNVVDLEGGFAAWRAAGYPVEEP